MLPTNGETVVKDIGLEGVNPKGYSTDGIPFHVHFRVCAAQPGSPAEWTN